MLILKRLALGLLLVIGLLAIIFVTELAPKDSQETVKVDFVVHDGQRSAEISQALESQNVIRNGFAFYLYLKLIRGKILPGTFELSANQSGSDIAGLLSTGHFKTTKITIIEGWRANQMEDYLVNDKHLSQFKGFTSVAEKYEGYLFPDTYDIKVDATSDQLVALMRDTFTSRTKDLRVTPETVILASIVEREAQDDQDRPLIAGVYANRIQQNMKLEADPTIQYAKGSWAALSTGDTKSVNSRYNTYLNTGWPPGPICSPGLKSLTAAANPASHDYLFFFSAKGQTYYSKTLVEQTAKIKQYF